MNINQLTEQFRLGRENQAKAIFASLFILSNQMQTIFDRDIPKITLKQFNLLSMVRLSEEPLSFSQAGELLGCSRQNVKKLALALEKKGFVRLTRDPSDQRVSLIEPTQALHDYYREEFSRYEKQLNVVFLDYTDEEMEAFYSHMMKLYDGIKALDERSQDENKK